MKMIYMKPKTITLHENHSTLHISHTFSGTQNIMYMSYDMIKSSEILFIH